ncbi:hypothetical protein STCU_12381 [Strigomonas culicis]|uniref:NmrA-like domain-containing protein n=1 Tax=Strigomonas culicis TaxID=28005 RepID=S9TFD4_9TRYP|nr:hypothetical protein STCU_12381 [Strigomonas culicis]|eukprot:EPY15043.1 hypothetical protein STCU_12381 [Strigomonas culicis]
MATLLVAGATGAIGQRVVREALRRTTGGIAQVVALTRRRVALKDRDDAAALQTYRELFDLDVEARGTYALERLQIVTFDWEAFFAFWKQLAQDPSLYCAATAAEAERGDSAGDAALRRQFDFLPVCVSGSDGGGVRARHDARRCGVRRRVHPHGLRLRDRIF